MASHVSQAGSGMRTLDPDRTWGEAKVCSSFYFTHENIQVQVPLKYLITLYWTIKCMSFIS